MCTYVPETFSFSRHIFNMRLLDMLSSRAFSETGKGKDAVVPVFVTLASGTVCTGSGIRYPVRAS